MGLFNFKKNAYKNNAVYAPVNGTFVNLENVDDQVFSKKMMGDGFAIEPKDGKFVAPCSGELVTVFPTKHAYGIKMVNGQEVLIHIGIDTVNLKGEGFDCKVKQGAKVNVGDVLVNVDLGAITKANLKTTTMIIVTSPDTFKIVKESNDLKALDEVIEF